LFADVLKEREALSAEGFLDAPSRALGGVIVNGDIVRTTVLNLTALRAIGGSVELRRYILGLALVAASAPLDLFLRQGCLLVRAVGRPMEQKLVYRDGTSEDSAECIKAAGAFASAAAEAFVVGKSRSVDFDPKLARAALDKSSEKKAKKAK
jgi:CRISPR-associated protein Csb1